MKLAVAPEGVRLSFKEIAECEDIPRDYLAKILRSLVSADIATSRRGAKGGYQLARDIELITFLDVMEAADSAIAINLCTQNGDGCLRTPECAMASVWQRTEDAMRTVLRQTTIADVLPKRGQIGSSELRLEDLMLDRRGSHPWESL
jgi:Rrf2 family protein